MRSPNARRRLALALAVLCVAVGGFPRLSLCVGSGGHVAIEPADAACCVRALAAGAGALALPEHCDDDCTDTPFDLRAASSPSSWRVVASPLLGTVLARSLDTVAGQAPGHSPAGDPPPAPDPPRRRCTTIHLL